MGKHLEYPSQTTVMKRLKNLRIDRQLSTEDCSRIIREATGYHFSRAMYAACEEGVTKNIPLWAVIALLGSEELGTMSADEIFGDVLYRW